MGITGVFCCEYSILPDHQTRDTCMTLFGGMSEQDDLKELGDVKLLGRWACVGEARGFCIAEANSVADVQKWLNNWTTMADIKVTPCLDDNEHRKLILGTDPTYSVVYENINAPPKDKESLYFIKYQFKPDCVVEGFKLFSTMTKELDEMDSGKCTSYGRWHVPSLGCGYAIASSPTVFDIYKWAFNWKDLCECTIVPVTHDSVTRQIIQEGLGFKIKHESITKKFQELSEPKSFLKKWISSFF